MDLSSIKSTIRLSFVPGDFQAGQSKCWDQAIRDLLATYKSSDHDSQMLIIQEFADDRIARIELLSFAHWEAIVAIRNENIELVRDGLTALIIEDAKDDYRDTLVVLSLLCHSARKLGADERALVKQAVSIATADTKKLFDSFMRRSLLIRR